MWGFIYVVVFLTAFLASVVMKMTADPFHGKYTVKWDEKRRNSLCGFVLWGGRSE